MEGISYSFTGLWNNLLGKNNPLLDASREGRVPRTSHTRHHAAGRDSSTPTKLSYRCKVWVYATGPPTPFWFRVCHSALEISVHDSAGNEKASYILDVGSWLSVPAATYRPIRYLSKKKWLELSSRCWDPLGGGLPTYYDIDKFIGEFTPTEFKEKLDSIRRKLTAKYQYPNYNRLTRNCNHFVADLLRELGIREEMSGYINRVPILADRFGYKDGVRGIVVCGWRV